MGLENKWKHFYKFLFLESRIDRFMDFHGFCISCIVYIDWRWFGLWSLMPLSTIFQLYRHSLNEVWKLNMNFVIEHLFWMLQFLDVLFRIRFEYLHLIYKYNSKYELLITFMIVSLPFSIVNSVINLMRSGCVKYWSQNSIYSFSFLIDLKFLN